MFDPTAKISIDTVAVRLLRAARESNVSRVAVCSAHQGDGKSTLIRTVGGVLERTDAPSTPTPNLTEGPSLLEPQGYLELEQVRGEVDAAVLVVRRRDTRADELSLMRAWFDAHHIPLLGVVFSPPHSLSIERVVAIYARLRAWFRRLLPARLRPSGPRHATDEDSPAVDIVELEERRDAV